SKRTRSRTHVGCVHVQILQGSWSKNQGPGDPAERNNLRCATFELEPALAQLENWLRPDLPERKNPIAVQCRDLISGYWQTTCAVSIFALPLGSASSFHPPFVLKRLEPCLCNGDSTFVTLLFSLWLRSFAIPESASFFRSASLV